MIEQENKRSSLVFVRYTLLCVTEPTVETFSTDVESFCAKGSVTQQGGFYHHSEGNWTVMQASWGTHPVSTAGVFFRSAGRFWAGRRWEPKAVVCFERREGAGLRRGQLVHAAELGSSGKVPSGEKHSLDGSIKWPSVMIYCMCFLASHLSASYQQLKTDYGKEIRHISSCSLAVFIFLLLMFH